MSIHPDQGIEPVIDEQPSGIRETPIPAVDPITDSPHGVKPIGGHGALGAVAGPATFDN